MMAWREAFAMAGLGESRRAAVVGPTSVSMLQI